MLALRGVLRGAVGGYRTLVGTNVAALRYLTKVRYTHTHLLTHADLVLSLFLVFVFVCFIPHATLMLLTYHCYVSSSFVF